MTRMSTAAWLQLADNRDLSIVVHDQLGEILRDLPTPTQQKPRLVHFLGRQRKHLALRYLFPHNNFGRWRNRCFTSLRVDTISSKTASPLFITESDLNGCFESLPREFLGESSARYPLRWFHKGLSDLDVNDTLQARMIFPFADVICVFIDDFGSVETVIQRLLRWSLLTNISTRRDHFAPQLLLVASEPKTVHDFNTILFKDRKHTLQQSFSSIEVFHLGSEALSPMARHRRLREKINLHSLLHLEHRRHRQLGFSALHFSALLAKNVEHVASNISDVFDMSRVARSLSQQSADMTAHITTFIQAATELNFPKSALTNFIASAICLDAYPKGMHVFEASLMYPYYEPLILDEVGFDLKSAIRTEFEEMHKALLEGESAFSLRRQSLARHSKRFDKLITNSTCLYCLGHAPEHVLGCGHTICDKCVQMFGTALPDVESRFLIRFCELCTSDTGSEIFLKPSTAGVRIISIDGGGTRGAVPLESLCILQDLLGQLPIRTCFDLALGTSSGGLITLGMFALNWTPKQCSQTFDALSRRVFERERRRSSYLTAAKKYLRCWLSDGVYDHTNLENCLQTIFGHNASMFGAPHRLPSNTKCAVTTSSIADGTPYLLSNYNGDNSEKKPQGYQLLRPDNVQHEPLIWQAARATSAAPVLFSSYNHTDLGAFQDGGLKHNNPSRIACWESRRIWPDIKTPDIFLSLGTGAPGRLPVGQKAPAFRNFLMDGFIPRLFRSCMAKADGEIMWNEFVNSLDEKAKGNYFRLNVPLQGAAMLDDVDSMESLRQSVRLQPDSTRIEVIRTLLSACLFFKLEQPLVRKGSSYHVYGSIRCRVDSNLIAGALATAGFMSTDFSTDIDVLARACAFESHVCEGCSLFRKYVSFYVRSPDETISIYMSSPTVSKYKISGFPQTLRWFEKQQGLDRVFGCLTDSISEPLDCKICQPRPTANHKREIQSPDLQTQRKKPRLLT